MRLPVCRLPRPSDSDTDRPLALVQTWTAPSGSIGEMILEPHDGHVHAWWRWDGDFAADMAGGDEDWEHFAACVLPVIRDLVTAFVAECPLDAWSAGLLEMDRTA